MFVLHPRWSVLHPCTKACALEPLQSSIFLAEDIAGALLCSGFEGSLPEGR